MPESRPIFEPSPTFCIRRCSMRLVCARHWGGILPGAARHVVAELVLFSCDCRSVHCERCDELAHSVMRLTRDAPAVFVLNFQQARHAHSSSAVVTLPPNKDSVTLEVRDNGRGICAETKAGILSGTSHGVGLRGMRKRVAAVGGTFTIESNDKGTSVRVRLPVERYLGPSAPRDEANGDPIAVVGHPMKGGSKAHYCSTP